MAIFFITLAKQKVWNKKKGQTYSTQIKVSIHCDAIRSEQFENGQFS